jgi:hypothetical protein
MCMVKNAGHYNTTMQVRAGDSVLGTNRPMHDMSAALLL